MTRLLVGPFNRVEGDLEVRLDIARGRVTSAQVNATMYRGFEQILQGKVPHDALVYRAAHLRHLLGVAVGGGGARAGRSGRHRDAAQRAHATNLILATENLADHLTHFYLFFMPDFARPVYAHAALARRGAAPLRARRRRAGARGHGGAPALAHAAGHAGRQVAAHADRSSPAAPRARSTRPNACACWPRCASSAASWRRSCSRAPLEAVAALDTEAALLGLARAGPAGAATCASFSRWSHDLKLDTLGPGPGPLPELWRLRAARGRLRACRRCVARADRRCRAAGPGRDHRRRHPRLAGARGEPLHPLHGLTRPEPDKPGAYTWNKAPRLAGEVVETGAIARQLASGHAAGARRGGAPRRHRLHARAGAPARTRARGADDGRLAAGDAPRPKPSACRPTLPDEGSGVGLSEAARGSLGHWVVVRRGRIANYQIVAPTSWNFSPRDAAGTPGALEQALVGAPVRDGETDAGGGAAHRALLRSLHGLHGALSAMTGKTAQPQPAGPRVPGIEGVDESTWLDVIQKMDEVYSRLIDDEVELEKKNTRAGAVAAVHLQRADVDVGRAGGLRRGTAGSNRPTPHCASWSVAPKTQLRGSRLFDAAGRCGQRAALARAAMIESDAPRSGQAIELNLLDRQGQPVPVDANCTPRIGANGRRVGTVWVGRPTAELKRAYHEMRAAHEALKRTQQQLLHSEKMASLGQLVAGVAHELNNPISFVLGNVHALRKYCDRLHDLPGRGARARARRPVLQSCARSCASSTCWATCPR